MNVFANVPAAVFSITCVQFVSGVVRRWVVALRTAAARNSAAAAGAANAAADAAKPGTDATATAANQA